MDWLITHAYWILGALAVLVGVLFCLHSALHVVRMRASSWGLALVAVSVILWPTRLWLLHHRPLGPADPTVHAIVTVALWLAIAAIPLAIVGKPRVAPLIVLASVITFVFWFRTAVPRETSLWTMLHVSNPISRMQPPSAKPSPIPANGQTAPTHSRP